MITSSPCRHNTSSLPVSLCRATTFQLTALGPPIMRKLLLRIPAPRARPGRGVFRAARVWGGIEPNDRVVLDELVERANKHALVCRVRPAVVDVVNLESHSASSRRSCVASRVI